MRKLFAFNMVTLDGYFEGSNHELDWHNVDEEFNEFAINQLSEIGTLLFGRKTYQMMASYWASPMAMEDDPIVAGMMNSMKKMVASKTLSEADWSNSKVISNNLADEISALKKQSGKDIAIFGSADLMSSLIDQNLVDDYRIIINPVILGSGRTLFQDLKSRINLRLVETRTFKSGNILLIYQPA